MDKWVSLAPLYLKCGVACGTIASLQLLLPSTAPSPSFLPFPPPCLASTSLLSLHPSLFLPNVPSPSFLPPCLACTSLLPLHPFFFLPLPPLPPSYPSLLPTSLLPHSFPSIFIPLSPLPPSLLLPSIVPPSRTFHRRVLNVQFPHKNSGKVFPNLMKHKRALLVKNLPYTTCLA